MKIYLKYIIVVGFISILFSQTVPPVPQLNLPPDSANISLTDIITRWLPAEGATLYDIEMDTTGRFHPDSLIFSSYSLTDTFSVINNLLFEHSYFWRVRSGNGAEYSAWSDPWHFTIVYPPLPVKVILKEPGYYEQNIPLKPLMKWDPVNGADRYQLQIATDIFSLIFFDKTDITAESLQIADGTLNELTDYYWRVRAENISGTGPWSEIWSFTTDYGTAPDQVILNQPANNGIDQSYNQTILEWYPSNRAVTYHLQVISESAQDFDKGPFFVNDSLLTGTQFSLSGLQPYTWYYWRLCAVNSSGKGVWSFVWSFQTRGEPVEKPVLIDPQDGLTDISLTPELKWGSLRTAERYGLQISYIYDFSTVAFSYPGITDTVKVVDRLQANTTYYWRVNANNNQVGSGPWSDTFYFTTGNENTSLPAPVLASPVENGTEIELTPQFNWSSVDNAQAYQIEVSTDAGFDSQYIIFAEYSVYQNYITFGSNLQGSTTYYWRVRSVDSGAGVGNWSSVWQFTTVAGIIATTYNEAQPGVVSAYVKGYIEVPAGRSDVYFEYYENGTDFSQMNANESPFYSQESRTVDVVLTDLSPGTYYTYRVVVSSDKGTVYGDQYSFNTSEYYQNYTMGYNLNLPQKNTPGDYTAYDYRLVGLPGESNQLLENFLPGEQGTDWQAYWDNGKDENYLVEYDHKQDGPFLTNAGKGFWLILRSQVYLDQQVSAVQLHNADMAQIWLHPGWNIITNPFSDRAVSWNDVQQINDFNEPLWSFDGSFNTATDLQPYQGYFVYNSTGSDGFLDIPYNGIPGPGSKLQENMKNGWQCKVMFKSDKHSDKILTWGISSQANNTFDRLDFHKPRAVGDIEDIYFNRPQWDEKYPRFACDIRSEIGEIQRWSFQVAAPEKSDILLECDDLQNIPQEFKVYLVDLNRAVGQDLREESVYRTTPAIENTPFELIVGTAEQVDKVLAELIPQEFSLGANFPNPFNPSTTIPVALPLESDITLTVYSLLGQKIKILHEGRLQAGRHYISWNGADELGRAVSSGVYFYILHVGNNKQLSGKMILLK